MGPSYLVAVFILSSWISLAAHSYIINNDPSNRAEHLDSEQKYYLEWQVDWSRKLITFNVTVNSTGYVLFGLANNASATTGADVVIGGVLPSGQSYFSDRYTLGDEIPQKDPTNQDDYVLHAARENKTHTVLSFSRDLDTCDRLDYPISDNRVTIIWGYGETDNYETSWKTGVQGSFNVYLLDLDHSPTIVRDQQQNPRMATQDNLQVWSIRRQIIIPDNATSYICTIHKAPRLQKKHHMVGFDVYFPSQGSRRRVHHLIILKCNSPRGKDPKVLFGPFVGGRGETCYTPLRPPSLTTEGRMPTYLCSQLWIQWAAGGRSYFTPPHVGTPFGQQADEFYMLQVHYDNPEQKSGVIVDMRLDSFYTSFVRPNDGGVLGIGQENPAIPPSILIPPGTPSQRIFHHCPGECTKRMLPKSGIKIFAVMMHSHRSGKMLRVRHFRGNHELPWVTFDDNFSNGFQQIRQLREEVKLLPGDQLTMECTYDNNWTNGTVVAGFSTKQETCFAFLLYYSRVEDYSFCRSEIVSEKYREKFLGVSNVTWNETKLEWEAVTPANLAGLTITEISDNHVSWDEEKRQELQRFHEAYPHVSRCSRDLAYRDPEDVKRLVGSDAGALTAYPTMSLNTRDDYIGPGLYPFWAKPYVAEQSCSFNGSSQR